MLLHCLLTHQVSKLTVQHFISHLSKWESLESGFKNEPWHLACALTHDNSTLLQDIEERKKWNRFLTHIMVTFTATNGISGSCALSQSSSKSRHRQNSGMVPSTGEGMWRPVRGHWHLYQSVIMCEVCVYHDQKMALICQQKLRNHVEFKYLRYWQQ